MCVYIMKTALKQTQLQYNIMLKQRGMFQNSVDIQIYVVVKAFPQSYMTARSAASNIPYARKDLGNCSFNEQVEEKM